MSYTVTVIFDNMEVDETHYFDKEGDARKCLAQLKASIVVSRCIKWNLRNSKTTCWDSR